ncbi:MAG: Hsp20/alpha crystallin family protein [Phycisphaerae bacterium]
MNLIPWRNKKSESDLAENDLRPTLRHFRSELDRMFDRFFSDPFDAWPDAFQMLRDWRPSLDLTETAQDVIVKAEMPGVDPKDIDVAISGNVLTISGEKRECAERTEGCCHQSERRFGGFRRSVQLPTSVDWEKVTAEHSNGVLTVRLQKLASSTPKRIHVKAR